MPLYLCDNGRNNQQNKIIVTQICLRHTMYYETQNEALQITLLKRRNILCVIHASRETIVCGLSFLSLFSSSSSLIADATTAAIIITAVVAADNIAFFYSQQTIRCSLYFLGAYIFYFI